ncbi:nitrate reductase [Maricurvus nonylphenolicus]|uniref:molybdopterin-dependent oxidoreductase n=1 Tax=Maricurvus nonylphenolicus TaxID=1008307 RepID=UPI0036F43E39
MQDLISSDINNDSLQTIKTTCAYCGVGCGIEAQVNPHTREVSVQGDFSHPANQGRLCSKGSSLGETVGLESRLLQPVVGGKTVSWDSALDTVSDKFKRIIDEHGPDAVAFYGSGQLLTEDYYVANKLMKGFIGSANIDTNSRLCMSSAVTGHKRAFGTDTVATCYDDLDHAQLIVLVGSNTAWCHPIVFQRIRSAKERNPDLKVVVIDPRRTATCDIADLHLPLASGSDVKLFNGLLHFLNQNDVLDHPFIEQSCDGSVAALEAAAEDAGNLDSVARYCNLPSADVERFYRWFADTDKAVSVYSQGVKQSSSGADKVNAIVNCHLLTGRIGKSGSGPLSLTGQPNAMGGREVGGLANQVAAHMEFHIEGDVDRVARFWQAPNMAREPGKPAVDLFDAIADGSIKAVWIMATNPVVSLPNADKVKAALENCEFVVVSDCVAESDTLALAHVKLPALGWSEKDGMVTNSERRITHQRALLPPAGEAKPDWWIISEVAKRLGFGEAFNYQHQIEIFREHAALSGFENNPFQRLRDFDISGLADISLEEYQSFTPKQWPINTDYPQGKARFFANGKFFTPNQRAQLVALTSRAPGNAVSQRYPLVLNTGRLRDQWHTMTRSALAPRLNQHRPEPFVEVHPDDAERYQLQHGGIAHLLSQWGQMYARVMVTDTQQQGNVFVPMHWSEQYAKKGRMGALVNPVVDPLSGQPESKHTPVSIRPLSAGWYGFVLSREPLADQNVEYQVKVNAEGYYRYELAAIKSIEGVAEHFQTLLNPEAQFEWQEFDDASAGVYRAACYNKQALQAVVCLAPSFAEVQLPARGWLGSMFVKSSLEPQERMALLAGIPTVGTEDVGATVCACFNVGEKTILKAINENKLTTYQEVGVCCKAGTNCGSCVPEIKTLLAQAVEVSS